MGIEERNGHLYFYLKRRVGDRVISEYCGQASLDEALANRRERREKDKERLKIKRANDEIESLDAGLNEISEFNRDLVAALFLISGYHQHKGQWRKKR